MLQNNIELDLKTKPIKSGTTQTKVAEKVVKMMDELSYDVELTYRKKDE